MPVTFEKSGQNLKPVFRCDVCSQFASEGFEVRLSLAIDRKDARLAGKWFCPEHAPVCVNKQEGMFDEEHS